MAGVVWIKDVSGGNNFLINRGSNGVKEANSLMILINIQLLEDVVNNLKSCGASDK